MPKRNAKGVTSGVGLPHRMTGRDGDITIRKTRDGKIVYIKEHGSWHPINTGVDVAQLKKDVDRLSRLFDNSNKNSNATITTNLINVRKNTSTATVDPKIKFIVGGTEEFVLGLDTNDSNKFKIDTGGTIGGATKITLDSSGNLTTAGSIDATKIKLTSTSPGEGYIGAAAADSHFLRTNDGSQNYFAMMVNASNVVQGNPSGQTVKFLDNLLSIMDNSDNSKGVAFQVSGVTTGNTRTLTIPDADGIIALTSDLTAIGGDIEGVTAGDGLSGGGTSGTVSLAISVDDSTIETDSDAIRVKDDGITYAKIQNVTATDRILGRDSSGAGVIEEITPANLRTMINVADGATAVTNHITNDADDTMVGTLTIDKNLDSTSATTTKGLHIDVDRVGDVSSGTDNNIGIDVDVNATGASGGSIFNTGLNIDLVGDDAGSGLSTGYGAIIDISGVDVCVGVHLDIIDGYPEYRAVSSADSGDYFTMTTTTHGATTLKTYDDDATAAHLTLDVDGDIELNADGGQVNIKDGLASHFTFDCDSTRIRIFDDDVASNHLTMTVGANGASTITTTDSTIGTAAHLTLDADGDIILDSDTGIFIAKKAGTEFSAANSAYAGMILGYTCVGADVADDSYTLTTSYVCFPDSGGTEIRVSFITPPSENVEIEAELFFNAGGATNDLFLSLSNNATYGSNTFTHDHQYEKLVVTPARAGGGTVTQKWLIKATNLAAIGSQNHIYIAAKTDSIVGTPIIKWGGDADEDFTNLVMKATALPATIVEGS